MAEKRENFDLVEIVRGHPFPKGPFFPVKNFGDAMDYQPKDGDVRIASYPKTGTNWLSYIVIQIVSKAELFPAFHEAGKIAPFMEMSGIEAVEALQRKPRIYKHHIAYNLVQKNSKSKCIYIYRHPEDTFVSYYHFIMSIEGRSLSQGAFDELFDRFLEGNVGYGSYFDHILSYYKHREDENLLMVSYEKLHANKREEMLRIAKFLGEEYYQYLKEDAEALNKIIEHTSFEYMKSNLNFDPKALVKVKENLPLDAPKINFFRKGIVGDGKNALSEDQRQKLKEVAEKVLEGTFIINDWYSK